MTLWQAIVLGVVQGLTEFLPISSTAHLRLVPALLHWDDPGAAFSAVIQIGTLVAVLAYFQRDIHRIGSAWLRETLAGRFGESLDARLGWMMIVATVPIVVCGLLFKEAIKGPLRSLKAISGALIALALVLIVAELFVRFRERRGKIARPLEAATWSDTFTIGLSQCMALIPGSSRSGVTITAGLFRGLTREAAARFSFLLSLPAVFGAGLYELVKERHELLAGSTEIANLAMATVVSGVVGYASIALLLRYLRRHTMYVFAFYRIALGLVLLGLLAAGILDPT
jgi:undecaprenyl-diphosphatase